VDYDDQGGLRQKLRDAAKIIYSFEAKEKIAKILDGFRPELVHLHIFQHQLSTSILPEIKKRGIPAVYTAHDLKSVCPNYKMLTHGTVCERCKGHRYYRCVRYRCTKNSYAKSLVNMVEMYSQLFWKHYDLIDLIITPSEFYRKKLVEFRFPDRKVIHIPNCVDVKRCVPKYQHKNYCLFLGRLSEEKGIGTLVEAMKTVKNGKLVIAGTGPLEKEISRKIESEKIRGIEMVGFKTGDDLAELIRNAICAVLPSEWYENGPMSLLESFAYGKPVIGSNIGGIPEHINEGVDGLLFEAGNSDDLAEKIRMMCADGKRTVEMGKRAREKAESLYSVESHMERLLEVYGRFVRC
jgi:glycosyltransferase involved in cell wall biosynthesis